MANDTTRNRQDSPAEDPLAELARLMGQEDEFADLMRKAQPAPRPAAPRPAAPAPGVAAAPPRAPLPPRPAPIRPAAPPPQRPASPAPSHSSFAALAADVYSDTPRRAGDGPQPRSERHSLEDAARDLNRNLVRPERPAPETRAFEPRVPDSRSADPRMSPPRPSAPQPRPAERAGSDAVARALSQPLDLGDEPVRSEPRSENAPPAWMSRGVAPRAEAPAARDFSAADDAYDYGSSAVADDGYGEDQHSDADFEVEDTERSAQSGRRRILVVGGLVAGAAVVIAGGYMLLARPGGGTSSSGEPPVIRADQGPNKVVPSQQAQEPASDGQKLIYDRVGGSAPTGNEKVVSSEEQPVDVSQAAQPQQPRVIQTAPSQTVTATSGQSGTEPKRVRTLTVRADGTIVEDGGPTPVPAGSQQAAVTQPTASAPIPLSSGSGAPVSTNPKPLASTPSIVPNVPAPAPRVAAAPAPAAQPAAPASSAAAPAGAYVVQVASVRTEAEAQSTIKSMQTKFPSVLNGQRSSVRRADLGDRGIYYRAQIGSFSSRDDAVKLCEALRAAGGDCMVQRN